MAAEMEVLVPHKADAAVMIQKTYRGYRARRKLADAAIMSKTHGWWNVVDSAVLQEHTLAYFAHSKSWKANDNWKRLKRKASKVGKGLEKDKKALKLTLQHWLEAIDARHRYGHNLRPYYSHWLELETNEPFFYWLDLGSGRQVEVQKCSRALLLEQQIKYLSPEQRRHYEVEIYNGKLFYKVSGELVNTPKTDRWIFVMSPYGRLYIGKKQKGVIQHSSFLAGGATTAAGRLVVEHGVLKLMEAHSGHYRPSPENFESLVQMLIESGADLHLAKVQLVSDDLLEKKKGKKLAGEVRAGIEHAGAEGNVAVNIENQKLVTVDSGVVNGLSEYLVTSLSFPEFADSIAKKRAAEELAAKKIETDKLALSKPEQILNNDVVVQQPPKDQLPVAAAQEDEPKSQEAEPKPQEDEPKPQQDEPKPQEDKPKPQEDEPKPQQDEPKPQQGEPKPQQGEPKPQQDEPKPQQHEPEPEQDEPKPQQDEPKPQPPVVEEKPSPNDLIAKRKPCPLVLPLPKSHLNPNLPKSPLPAVPTSPGFSRNSSLATLGPQERRQTLKKYGPKKTALRQTP